MPILLFDQELEIFEQLYEDGYPYAQLLYVSGFRRRMDYGTFTVGDTEKSLVSEDFLRNLLYRAPKPGSHNSEKNRSRHFVRRQIDVLVGLELLAYLPKQKRTSPMRFYFPVAARAAELRAQEERTKESAKERAEGENNMWGYTGVGNTLNYKNIVVGDGVCLSAGANNSFEQGSDLRSELSLVNINNNKNKTISGGNETEFYNPDFQDGGIIRHEQSGVCVSEGWRPSEELVGALSVKHRVPYGFVERRALFFRMNAMELGTLSENWDVYFMNWFNRGVYSGHPDYLADLENYYRMQKQAG